MRLKFVKKFIQFIKITNCVCGRICNGCDAAVMRARTHTHTICDFNQFYELLNEFQTHNLHISIHS